MLYIAFMRPFLIRIFAMVFFPLAVAAVAADTAPSLDLHDLQGAPHKLEDYRGKPVVLNFWATWCVPCAAEMPLLNEMQDRYKGKAVFIAASVDDDDMKAAVQSFIKKHQGTDLSVMMGATLESLHDFGLEDVMPGTVFIDSDGNIVGRLSGALKRPDLEQRMLKLAGKPAPLPATKKPAKKSVAKKP
jgi:thiol-disulfide isomerase/thioredoxin